MGEPGACAVLKPSGARFRLLGRRIPAIPDVAACKFFARVLDHCAYKHVQCRMEDSASMLETQNLDSNGLAALAAEWRRRALRGEENARGIAHALEAEVRRIGGTRPVPAHDLDTRPLALRQPDRPWWKPW